MMMSESKPLTLILEALEYLDTIPLIPVESCRTVPSRVVLQGTIVPSTHICIIPTFHTFFTPNIFLQRAKIVLTVADADSFVPTSAQTNHPDKTCSKLIQILHTFLNPTFLQCKMVGKQQIKCITNNNFISVISKMFLKICRQLFHTFQRNVFWL